jgi:hypothetical protein
MYDIFDTPTDFVEACRRKLRFSSQKAMEPNQGFIRTTQKRTH